MQTDPNFANYLYQPESGRVALLDFGATKAFSAEFVARYARITPARSSRATSMRWVGKQSRLVMSAQTIRPTASGRESR